MKKLLKWLLLLLVALTMAVVLVLYNPGFIKGPLERYISDLAGYPVTLEGELEIGTGRFIEITAWGVHVSSPAGSRHEDLAAIGYFNLVLKTASVFKDIVVIESLQIDDLQLNVETDGDGIGNWIIADKPSVPADSDGGGVVPVFNDIQARNATFRFYNGKTGIENLLTIDSLGHHQQADGMLHTILNGNLNNRPVEYSHTFGPYKNLLDGNDISYNASGHFGELVLEGDAYIDSLESPRKPKFNLSMVGPNIDEITAMLGIEDLGGGGFTLRASGNQSDDSYEAELNGQVGDISINATAQSSDIEQLNQLDLNVAMNGPRLGALLRVFGYENWPDEPFNLKGQANRVGGTLNVRDLTLNIGGMQLLFDGLLTEFPSLEASRVKLLISGDDAKQFHKLLGYKGIATGPYELRAELNASAGNVELLQVEADTSLGHATLSGYLIPGPSYIGSKFDLHLEGGNANTVMSVFGVDMLPHKPFDLNTSVEIVENGLRVEHGGLVTIEDERLELGGFIAFGDGSQGTDVDVKLHGNQLARLFRQYLGNIGIPDYPYELNGHIRVLDQGIRLDNLELGFEDVRLKTDGLIALHPKLTGTVLDFRIEGGNLSSLGNFEAIGDRLGVFVPGQSYQASGRFEVEHALWKLDAVKGRIGSTDLNLDVLISRQRDRSGSSLRLSASGPDLNELLLKDGEPGLPDGAFKSSVELLLTDNMLSISEFSFDTAHARGRADVELGWPFVSSNNINFNVDVRGDDIRNFLHKIDAFETAMAPFRFTAVGSKKGDLVTLSRFASSIGNLQVSMTGRVDDNPDDDRVEIAFKLSSEDISKLGQWNGESLPSLPLDISSDFKGHAREFIFTNLVGSLGNSRLQGELDVSLMGSKPDIRLNATSDYIDIRPFLDSNDGEPGDESIEKTKPDLLIPAIPLPLESLTARDLKINLNVAELRYRQDSITNLVLDAEQRAGNLNLSRLFFDGPRGNLMVSGFIHPTGAHSANVLVDLHAKGLSLNLSGQADEKLDQVPVFDFDFHATGIGGDLREVAASMNGSFYMGSKGGNAANVDLGLLDTFIVDQIFSVVMPKSRNTKDTQFSCIATILDIQDGLVTTRPAFSFSTQKIAVVNKGTLDLKTEKMNFNFNSTPTNALQISPGEMFYPYLLITGTLANPSVKVSPGKAVLHGGAAIATMGVSVLAKGLLDRAGNAVPVCNEMLENPPEE